MSLFIVCAARQFFFIIISRNCKTSAITVFFTHHAWWNKTNPLILVPGHLLPKWGPYLNLTVSHRYQVPEVPQLIPNWSTSLLCGRFGARGVSKAPLFHLFHLYLQVFIAGSLFWHSIGQPLLWKLKFIFWLLPYSFIILPVMAQEVVDFNLPLLARQDNLNGLNKALSQGADVDEKDHVCFIHLIIFSNFIFIYVFDCLPVIFNCGHAVWQNCPYPGSRRRPRITCGLFVGEWCKCQHCRQGMH